MLDLVRNPEDWLSHVPVHFMYVSAGKVKLVVKPCRNCGRKFVPESLVSDESEEEIRCVFDDN